MEIFVDYIEATADVWLENGRNYNYNNFLIVGLIPQYPKKRSLLKFEDIPSSCEQVISAHMYLYYWYAHKASWQTEQQAPFIPRPLQVRQVLKSWTENQATRYNRFHSAPWSTSYLGLDDTDAKSYVDDTLTISNRDSPGYVKWNITYAARNWKNGQNNYGVIISASNENTFGRSIRFRSREYVGRKPYVDVLCGGSSTTTTDGPTTISTTPATTTDAVTTTAITGT